MSFYWPRPGYLGLLQNTACVAGLSSPSVTHMPYFALWESRVKGFKRILTIKNSIWCLRSIKMTVPHRPANGQSSVLWLSGTRLSIMQLHFITLTPCGISSRREEARQRQWHYSWNLLCVRHWHVCLSGNVLELTRPLVEQRRTTQAFTVQ